MLSWAFTSSRMWAAGQARVVAGRYSLGLVYVLFKDLRPCQPTDTAVVDLQDSRSAARCIGNADLTVRLQRAPRSRFNVRCAKSVPRFELEPASLQFSAPRRVVCKSAAQASGVRYLHRAHQMERPGGLPVHVAGLLCVVRLQPASC